MNRAEILTEWLSPDANGDANRPRLGDDYVVSKWEDITGQPAVNLTPNPNLYSVYCECDDATLAAINADSNYYVVWSEQIAEAA